MLTSQQWCNSPVKTATGAGRVRHAEVVRSDAGVHPAGNWWAWWRMHTTTPLVATRRSSPCSAGGQHPYGEEEISRLEDGPLPAKVGFLEPIVDAVFREAVAIDQQFREAKAVQKGEVELAFTRSANGSGC